LPCQTISDNYDDLFDCIYCSSGFEYNLETDICIKCTENCEVCEINANCILCKEDFNLINQQCYEISNIDSSSDWSSDRNLFLDYESSVLNATNSSSTTTPSSGNGWIAGVVIGAVLLILLFLCYKFKWYHICWKPKPPLQQQPPRLVYPPSSVMQPGQYYPSQPKISYVYVDPSRPGNYSISGYPANPSIPPNLPVAPPTTTENFAPSQQMSLAPPATEMQNLTGSNANASNPDDDESKLCVVCQTNRKDTVFSPCGHVACCLECAAALIEKNPECPMCRVHIEEVIKCYI